MITELIFVFVFLHIAPPEIQVACFIGADNVKEVLGDFTNKINWDNTNEVVKKCAKLAHAKDYTLFALGKKGLCLSGADMKHKYYVSGSDGANCQDGIGMWNSMFVYSLGKHWSFLQLKLGNTKQFYEKG